jgi:hypothetical protein
VDSSPLYEVLYIPITLMVRGGCPQTSSSPYLLVFHYLAYSDGWSENIFSKNFLLHSDKELVAIPSSASSFGLVSYPSKLWETLPTVCTGRNTYVLFSILHSRTWGYQTQLCPYKTMVNNIEIVGFLPCPPRYKVRTLVISGICL